MQHIQFKNLNGKLKKNSKLKKDQLNTAKFKGIQKKLKENSIEFDEIHTNATKNGIVIFYVIKTNFEQQKKSLQL